MKYIILLISIVFLTGCSKENNQGNEPVDPPSSPSFGIYFLKDTTQKMQDLPARDLSLLELQSSPWISDKDIEFYDWSSHCIYLKNDKSNFFLNYPSGIEFPDNWWSRPLVFVANGKNVSIGYLFSGAHSPLYDFPHIWEMDLRYFPNDILRFEWPFYNEEDKRNVGDIRKSLSELNLLHNGIIVTIDSLKINNADTATVAYKFTIRNMDTDNLYVPDPDKMGSDLFHYFTKGPRFYNIKQEKRYEAVYKKIIKSNPVFDSKWFTKIESGKMITRTIDLKGYPHFPNGDYSCKLEFGSPIRILKENRILPDGRYWIGYANSSFINLTLE